MKISELENKLRRHAETTKSVLQPPFDLKEEIKNMEEHAMRKSKSVIKRTIAVAAVLTLCIITVTISPLANGIKGFFSDIIRFDGAIIGTCYENATNDIKISVIETEKDSGFIPMELSFIYPNEAPFAHIQEIAVADYMIVDNTTGEIIKLVSYPEYSAKGTIKDGKALVNLSLYHTNFEPGEEYTIVIEKMYGLTKADSPLHITGKWECSFIKQPS